MFVNEGWCGVAGHRDSGCKPRILSVVALCRAGSESHHLERQSCGLWKWVSCGEPRLSDRSTARVCCRGDFDDDGSRTNRFKGLPLEPHTEPLKADPRKD